jgi:hypothetical protein
MPAQVLISQEHDGVVLLTLNRPGARNALNAELTQALCDAVATNQDEQPRDRVRPLRRDWEESFDPPVAEGGRVHAQHARAGGFGGNLGAEIAERRDDVLARSRDQRRR